MATPLSLPSPTLSHAHAGYNPETDLFSSLDFLALTGMDGSSIHGTAESVSTPKMGTAVVGSSSVYGSPYMTGNDNGNGTENGVSPSQSEILTHTYTSEPGPGPSTASLRAQSSQSSSNPDPTSHSNSNPEPKPTPSTNNSRRNSLIEPEIVNNLATNGSIAAALALARNTSGKGKPRGRSKKKALKDMPIDGGRRESPLGQRVEREGIEGDRYPPDGVYSAAQPQTQTQPHPLPQAQSQQSQHLHHQQMMLSYQNMMAGLTEDQLNAMAAMSSGGAGDGGGGGDQQQHGSGNSSASASASGNMDRTRFNGMESTEDMENLMGSLQGMDQSLSMNFSLGDGNFDAVQAALLQQQLESIHMQSPLIFDPHNPQSPYHPLAQMYLASPAVLQHQHNQQQRSNERDGQQEDSVDKDDQRWRQNGMGLLTPGPSGEMFPEMRNEMMSPMQLEMLARDGMDGNSDFNVIPLLSPALTNHNSSAFTSPADHAAFNSSSNGNNQGQMSNGQHMPQDHNATHYSQNQQQLERLQSQQRQFQEQLQFLQHQQRQMAVTAAAVAAASGSPYMSSNPSSSGGLSRPVTTPSAQGQQGGSIGTPSPGYFSPLTSPALGPTPVRGQPYNGHHYHNAYSPNVPSHQHRTPHPLSALSSPALNPVGSSGGAQQTLSPAFGPQSNADMADPDYISQLVGYMDGNQDSNQAQNTSQIQTTNIQAHAQQSPYDQEYYGSPVISTDGRLSNLASPALGSSNSTGPHRSSLPAKSRPSPMMKPTHRSHQRQASLNMGLPSPGLPGPSNMLPMNTHLASPLGYNKFHSVIPGMGYLPPAAIDSRGVAQHQKSLQSGPASVSSTPSPVDLTQIMPPPPVPSSGGIQKQKGMTPMTPASLMNLGQGNAPDNPSHPSSSSNGKRGAANKAVSVSGAAGYNHVGSSGRAAKKVTVGIGSPAMGPSSKKAIGKSAAMMPGPSGATAGNKRNIAIRPPGGVGVRAATKAAAAAAAMQGEPETRRTSHKAAEQKRRDSLKAGFDELRLLLPPINTEALDPESGEPIPGSSAPRLLPKSSLVPDDNPNRGVSKVALLKYSNEYIGRLHDKIGKRDWYIEKLREEVLRLRNGEGDEVRGDDGEDLLELDMLVGEEEDEAPEDDSGQEADEGGDEDGDVDVDVDDDDEAEGVSFDNLETVDEDGDAEMGDDDDEYVKGGKPRRAKSINGGSAHGKFRGRKPSLLRSGSGGV